MSVKERPNVMYLECEGVVRVWTCIFIHVLFSLLMHTHCPKQLITTGASSLVNDIFFTDINKLLKSGQSVTSLFPHYKLKMMV